MLPNIETDANANADGNADADADVDVDVDFDADADGEAFVVPSLIGVLNHIQLERKTNNKSIIGTDNTYNMLAHRLLPNLKIF